MNSLHIRIPVLLVTFTIFFILAGCEGKQSILDPAGPAALAVSKLWWGMFVYSAIVLISIIIIWLYAMRPKTQIADKNQVKKLRAYFIIGGGIFFPLTSIIILLFFGIPIGYHMLPLPTLGQTPLRIEVTGHQWWWEVYYPEAGIRVVNELHLPIGRTVDIYAATGDVIHSFWIPRINGKIDMVPGRINKLRLKITKAGRFRGQCAEFCGKEHARMILNVKADTPETFAAWLQEQKPKEVLND